MQGLWLADRLLTLRTDLPEPVAPGEVIVKVTLAGVCNTDLEVMRGYRAMEGVLGHEFVGSAVDPGPLAGQRVVGEINIRPPGCQCPACARGDVTQCVHRTVLGINGRDGAFAEYLSLPIENLHRVPDNVPDEAAVFVEPLAAACEILEQIMVGPTDRAIVVGPGKLGLLCAQVLATTGCSMTVVGRRRSALDLARRLGLTACEASEAQAGADIVVDCTGTADGFVAARSLVRPRGTLVLKSTYVGDLTVDMSRIVVDEIRLIGSRCGPFPRALALLASGAVRVLPLIEARYALTDGLAALTHAQRPGALKILIDPLA